MGFYIHLTITVIILSSPVYSCVHLKLIGSVKPFTIIMLQYLCAFISELSIKVKSENSTTAMNIGTATHCMLRNLWVFPCSF